MEGGSLARRPVRVGAVSYLNTKPLVYGLERLAPGIELSFDLPSHLADALAEQRLDVALIPCIEAFQNPAYRVVSNACIGCRGPVLSVKLFSRRPLSEIRKLALDEGSRTSAALVRILLAERYGLRPQLARLPIGCSPSDTDADAVLLIGDRAIHGPGERFVAQWDLGEEWCRWSELPFVFAMWTARSGFSSDGLTEALQRSRDQGLANLEHIAEREAALVGLTYEQCLTYLRDNLYFYLGARELQGLELFHRRAVRLGLAPPLALPETLLAGSPAEADSAEADSSAGCERIPVREEVIGE